MKRRNLIAIAIGVLMAGGVEMALAVSAPVTFVALTGTTGGVPAGTTVFRADLSGVGLSSIQSITLTDTSGGVGGSSGQFSGFDLDAIRLSTSSVGTAAAANALAGLSVFDFSPAGTLFTPGTQRPPVDPALFGTSGGNINNAVATLGAFDGNSTTGPTANGFVSLGDGGIVSFNLTSTVSTTGLFLYVGEVGGNGETLTGGVTVSDQPTIPEPATMLLLGSGLAGLAGWRRIKNN